MIKLFQREACAASARVRTVLTELNLTVEIVNVPKLASERKELAALLGEERPSVPVLVDGDVVIRESEEIVRYLRALPGVSWFGDPSYGLTRTLKGVSFADAVPAVKEALASQGFGVLTEIDLKATMKKKLDVELRNYLILGACNPPLAHEAITAEPAIGLLLPCNVIVTEDEAGNAVVSAIDAIKMFDLVKEPAVQPVAREVRGKLVEALAAIAAR